MSNLEAPRPITAPAAEPSLPPRQGADVMEPRDVPLGGPRAMSVRRTLPQRHRSLIGAWCFLDHYGPARVSDTGGMKVPPHPHTGLQTVSWLFSGEIEHRDSAGTHAVIRPGHLNLMTAGSGVSHSEVSTPDTDLLHGVQLWVALPEHRRTIDRRFDHFAPAPVEAEGYRLTVFLGSVGGVSSPVPTHTPLVGAEVLVRPSGAATIPLDRDFEHGFLVDTGAVSLDDQPVPPDSLAYLPVGRASVTLRNTSDTPARLILIGGTPFGEEIVMWWNFVGRSHEEIVEYRARWQDEISPGSGSRHPSFGLPDDDPLEPLPAPELPTVRIRPRRNR
ncbi:pirin family protein [Arthrobacter sp. B1805]|uniref:pirin family protein n=1 Tax=Arthrobacter sp. B1805 TaxID=2058892 RepID=UPI000CE51344|nr:pirin family protein [Arthrobacter sp. B1805]